MKSFAQFMMNIPREYVPRIEEALSNAVRVLGDPNSTDEQYGAVTHQLAQLAVLQHRVGADTVKALKGELEERLKVRWLEAGRSGLDIPQYVTPRINDLLAHVERGRHMVKPSFWTYSNTVVALGGAFALAAGVVFLGGLQEGENLAGLVQNVMRSGQVASTLLRTRVSAGDFADLTSRLRTPQPIAVPTPALPAPVAAVAHQPAAVAIERSDGSTESLTVPFVDVYRALPRRVQDEVNNAIGSLPETPPASSRKCTRSIDVRSEVGRFRSSVTLSC